jgi:dipeptidyl aminopeptidase/acylaminoacyl peptidase
MRKPVSSPYGSWKSPITSDLIVSDATRLGSIQVDEKGACWIEGRPEENGRSVVVYQPGDGNRIDLISAPFNARSRVHEYGGGAYLATDACVYFSNFEDQRLYRIDLGKLTNGPEPVTPPNNCRYANAVNDPTRQRLICVLEDHSQSDQEAVNSIAAIDTNSGDITILTSGYDFYSSPVLSPDNSQLAWFCWNHPNMPWDESEIWLADIDESGTLVNPMKVAGGIDESVGQPTWSPDGVLYFLSDRTGWWNIYRFNNREIELVYEDDAEFNTPHWVFDEPTIDFLSPDQLICIRSSMGVQSLVRLTLDSATSSLAVSTTIDIPYDTLGSLRVKDGFAWFIGASATQPGTIFKLDLESGECIAVKRSSDQVPDSSFLSVPETVEFPTTDGLSAHGFYYAPKNPDFEPIEGEHPPLILFIHGGPTGATNSAYSPAIQYWTSRGFAILDLNYGGSTGYGRQYRNRLYGNWGIVDVADCENGARYLVSKGLADGERLAIRGGSAGGYTTLAALTFTDSFKAGASYYGVSDLEALARDTHKFESRYLDRIVGPYPSAMDLYKARSPINHVEKLACPVIFFQGLEDRVVPPNQAEMMVSALQKKGLPVAYVPFEGEQHGFRIAANIKRSLDAELYFYSRVFHFELADEVESVAIDNLD